MTKLHRILALPFIVLLLAGCAGNGYRYVNQGENSYIILQNIEEEEQNDQFTILETVPEIRFSSVSEMKHAIKTGSFTENQRKEINRFTKNEKGQIQALDLSNLYEATYPESYSLEYVSWTGSSYCFSLRKDSAQAVMCKLSKERFDDEKQKNVAVYSNGNNKVISTQKLVDRDATEIIFSTWTGIKRDLIYTVTEAEKTLYVVEMYEQHKITSAPYAVEILIEQGGQYVNVYISNPSSRPTTDEIKAFGLLNFK